MNLIKFMDSVINSFFMYTIFSDNNKVFQTYKLIIEK
jgi:hypothetical protein